MKTIRLVLFPLVFIMMFSCKEYQPLIECSVNGTEVKIEGTGNVLAQYVNMGAFTRSSVGGSDGTWAVNIRFDANIPGNYNCGPSGSGALEVYDGTQTYSTEHPGGSGLIEVLTAGNNLIEGYFSGSLSDGSTTIAVTNGLFSGRVY